VEVTVAPVRNPFARQLAQGRLGAIDLPYLIASGFAQPDEVRRQLLLPKFSRDINESSTQFRPMFHHQIGKCLRVVELRYDERILLVRVRVDVHTTPFRSAAGKLAPGVPTHMES
jgi:hypothetical protein